MAGCPISISSIVPKTDRGYELNHQFILDQIGYDLWSVSWVRLKRISEGEDQPASILMDGEVLFASSEEDLRRLEDLKNNFQQNLKDEAVVRKMSARYLEKAKAIYFDLKNAESSKAYIGAINIAETLLVAIAHLNGTYIRKGVKRIENELDRMSQVPYGFLENYRKMIRTTGEGEVVQIARELIAATEMIWKSKFAPEGQTPDPSDLTGFYEEFKSTYNKILTACEGKNYENAYYAGYMIDRETGFFLTRFTGPGSFPNILPEVLGNDFETVRACCLEHERQLVRLLDQHGIVINAYPDVNEFRQRFLHPTA
jgi:hypothetical protein